MTRRHIVSCLGMVQLPPGHPGLPSGYKYPAWGMLLELSKVRAMDKDGVARLGLVLQAASSAWLTDTTRHGTWH